MTLIDIIPIPENILNILQISWEIIKVWWWLLLPFILWGFLKYHYLYFIQENWDKTIKNTLIEIKMPKEIVKPIKAMEYVFAGFHGIIYASPNWRERWIEGEFGLNLTFEIVSIGGKIHFYIRTPEHLRSFVESNIYSQYPDAEISLVNDYTKKVPQNIPNKDWNIWGADYINVKDEAYPIKTYKDFEAENEKFEEKKIDSLSVFLEGMSALSPGEQMWFQIRVKPVLGENPWQKKGRALADKLARRPEKAKPKSIFLEALEIIIHGPLPEKPKDKEFFLPEMQLTPGEKQVLTAVEEKLSKLGFDCSIRFIYLAKRDIFLNPRITTIMSFFKEIATENMNSLKPAPATKTKVKSAVFWFLDKRRLYLRQRRIFRYYTNRLSPLFPRPGLTFILNTEELATLFHFPSEATISTLAVPRVDVKKKQAPFNLPIEE